MSGGEFGMLVLETVLRIRREFASGKAIKAIARDLRLSRKVVRKAIREPDAEFAYRRAVQPLPRLAPFQARLDELLEEDEARPRREKLRMTRVHDLLVREGFDGSYDAVRRYAAGWRLKRRRGVADAPTFIPLMFQPGEAYQFDWSHEDVEIAGKPMRVKVAHMRLCASRAIYVRAYPRETQEMLFDAHARAFAFFGGVPTRGIYDNMKTAVTTVFTGKDRVFNRRFLVMASHYMVEPTACSPAAGWEKGQVEHQVQTARGRFFQPRRFFGRDRTLYDPWHYLPVLATKPGALRNGAPFQDWELPPGLARLRRKLGAGDEADRRFVRVLAAVLEDGLEPVEAAAREALAAGTVSDDVILNILARRREPPRPLSIVTPDDLALRHPPLADCDRYDSLRGMHAAA